MGYTQRQTRLSTTQLGRPSRRWRMFTLALVCSSIVGLTALTWWGGAVTASMEPLQRWCTSTRQVEGFGIARNIPTRLVRFTEMPAFEAEPSPESDEAWRTLSMGHSLVELNKSEARAMDIGDGLPTANPASELYGVSWTHQLHCLGMIRQGFWDVFRQRNEFLDPSSSAPPKESKSDLKAHYLDHLQHCFDYLQQAILCAGDVTLEGRAPEATEETPKINGYGAVHQCKDMNAVSEWMKKHAVKSRPRFATQGHSTHGHVNGGYGS